MKLFAMFASLVAVVSAAAVAATTKQNPPKRPFTPYFHLQVEHSANKSLEGQYFFVGQGFDSTIRLTPNRSDAATFYNGFYEGQKPKPGPVLVNNATNFQDSSSMWIAGTSTCDTCGLPFSASGFFRSIQDWKDDGGFLYDFKINLFTHDVLFNQTDEGSLSQTLTQVCYADFANMYRFVVLAEYLKECTPVKLKWRFAGW